MYLYIYLFIEFHMHTHFYIKCECEKETNTIFVLPDYKSSTIYFCDTVWRLSWRAI